MVDSSLTLKPINDLLDMKFFIPSYQRGYRWKKTQVKNLLDDILEFRNQSEDKSKDVFYCLQPLIITKKDDVWILVDGQQRVTTIYLILAYLNDILKLLGKTKFKIKYQTRPDSETFLDAIDKTKMFDNIDYFHISEAHDAIQEWFDKKDGNAKLGLAQTLLNDKITGKNVQVIWYEIKNENASEIFTRINVGKIPLTNAELIKALFLKKGNFKNNSNNNSNNIYLRQLEIATEWDRIESTLQDDKFWYFINTTPDKYDTRIEYIFDLMKSKKWSDEDYFTFYKFQKEFESKNIETVWKAIKQYFMTIEQWYNDREFYHLIGYLIHTNYDLNDLLKKARKKTKTEFKLYLKQKISEQFAKIVINELQYKNKHIKNVLLLFNIQTIIKNKESHIRFPFDEYKKQDWDIEHIRSVKSEKPSNLSSQKRWLDNIYEYYLGHSYSQEIQIETPKAEPLKSVTNLLVKDKFTDDEFDIAYHLVLNEFNENNEDDLTDSISNLTLLDAFTNRSYKNAVFPIKRNRIIDNDRKGSFVPICTKNVFLKYYSKKSDGLMFWQKADADSYLIAINETLSEYTLKPNVKNG